jgi:2-polyprenyl-3-methyl-5-hydroxy-6-metoxy-1,4-benzoquinol methylase
MKKINLSKRLAVHGFLFTMAIAACNAQNHKHMKDHHHANEHHHHSVQEMVKHLDAKDRDEWQKPNEVLELIGNLKGKTIMDIGAGTGYFSFKLVKAGARVIAADAEQEYIHILKERQAEKQISDDQFVTRKIPFDNPMLQKKEVDYVLIVDTYHHIHNRVDYFTKVNSGIKPEGKLVVVDYKKDRAVKGGPSYEMRLSEETVINELKKAGFIDFKITSDLLTKQYVIEAFKNKEVVKSETEVMKVHWNKLYSEDEYVFGTKPDKYFEKILPQYETGKILLPGEGEGRNAVFAAKTGWEVYAYDISEEAKGKAERLAEANDVNINYEVGDVIESNYPEESFDAVAYLFLHYGGKDRIKIHQKLDKHLKKGGVLIIQAFSTEHPKYSSKGPQDQINLYSKDDILRDFPDYEIKELKVEKDYLDEGASTMGDCSIFRFVGIKK